ncbi:MAG: hypothetical protein WB919_13445 [Candidatus Sulfotelmatobacter sp.]
MAVQTVRTEAGDKQVQYDLGAEIGTEPFSVNQPRHPEYQIGGPTGCTGCRVGWVKFTPFADPQDIRRLTDLNFACITRWRQCTEQADILPDAWRELRAEMVKQEENPPDPCSPAVIRSSSRRTHSVELLRVVKLQSGGEPRLMTVSREPDDTSPRAYERPEFQLPEDLLGLGRVHIGEQFLLLYAGACGAVPASEENLAAARLGASEGWADPAHPLSLPFGTIKPPAIDIR